MTTAQTQDDTRTWYLDAAEITATIAKLRKINERAMAHGLEGRWTWQAGAERREPVYDETGARMVVNGIPHYIEQGHPVPCPLISYKVTRELTVTGVAPKLAGWTFLATLTWEGGTFVSRCAPGFAGRVDEDSVTPQWCDHCQTARGRLDTYLVEDEAGARKQVGSTCVKDFLGHDFRPSWISSGEDDLDKLEQSFTGHGYADADVLTVLTWAAALTEQFGWVSREKAEAECRESSSNMLKDVLFGSHTKARELRAAVAPTSEHQDQAAIVLSWAQALPGYVDSEYLANVRRLAHAQYVTERNVGILGSAVASWHREQQRNAEREARKSSEWLGELKARITVTATLRTDTPVAGDWGVGHRYGFLTADGNSVVWWASSDQGLVVDQGYDVTGTVKEHETWKDVRSTVLSRCKVTETQAPAATSKGAA